MKLLSESEQNLKETKRAFSEEDLKGVKNPLWSYQDKNQNFLMIM